MRRIRPIPGNQRGVALLAAMFMIVLATTFVSALIWTSHVEARRTRSLLSIDQGAQYALGGEAWAAEILTTDKQESEIDSLDEAWASALPGFPIDGGQIQGQLEDLQGRFNLNNLVNDTGTKDLVWFGVFQRLLETLNIEAQVADQVLDWLDPDAEVSFPAGAEDDVYTGVEPYGYRPANSFVTHASELLAIAGIDRETYALLRPHVTALPPGTKININTATDAVIASLSESVSILDAQSILEVRTDSPFTSVDELQGYVDPDAYGLVDFSSDFFQLTTVVSIDISRYTMLSILERNAQTGSTVARVRNLTND